jgi:hypothetical protein
MLHAAEHYELESKRAHDAAERATTVREHIRHLQTAQKYAKLASAARKRLNIYGFTSSQK